MLKTKKAMFVPDKEKLLIFMCWLVYTSSYLGRYSYNANINSIMSEYDVSHASAGLVATFFFFAYGAGQIINGILCKYYPKRYVIAVALAVSSAANILAFIGVPFIVIKYLWLINGFALSMLWSSLILTLSEYISARNMPKAIIVMSSCTALGNFCAYGLAGICSRFEHYKLSFIISALVIIFVAFCWFCVFPTVSKVKVGEVSKASEEDSKTSGSFGSAIIIMIVILCVFAVADNLIKDGLHTWIPSVLSELFGVKQSNSVFMTMLLNLLGVCGAYAATLFHKRIHNFIVLGTVFFALTVLFVGIIIYSLRISLIVVYIAFGTVLIATHAINNILTNMAPIYMRDKINSGMLSGILNGCCYMGSTFSSYGLGNIADKHGWNTVFILLGAMAVIMTAIGGIYYAVMHKSKNS